jgi:hypothetical protein
MISFGTWRSKQMGTYNSTIIWVCDGLTIIISTKQPDFRCRIVGLHPLEVAQIATVGGKNVRKFTEVALFNLSRCVFDGYLVLFASRDRAAHVLAFEVIRLRKHCGSPLIGVLADMIGGCSTAVNLF